MKKISWFLGLVGLIGLLILPITAARAANTGIQISPVTFNFDIKPGESATGKIIVTNRNDEMMDYVIELELFENSSETGEPSFTAVKPAEGASTFLNWVTFPDGDKGSIDVGKNKEVPFTITLPANAEPGGHYGAIFVKQTKPVIQGGNQVGVTARVGALVLISVPGKTTQGAKILEFNAPKFVWQGPVNFKMRVENTGTVHYDSKATASIKNIIGSPYNFDMGTHTILPKSIRAYEAAWAAKYPFGYYTITPTATDGNEATISGTAVTLIAIPLLIVIPIIVGLIIVIWLIVYMKRHVRIVK